jgi:hypothetical protein
MVNKRLRIKKTRQTLNLDATDRGADWIKGTWDGPPAGSKEMEKLQAASGGKPLRPSWPELKDGEDYVPNP